MDKVIRVGPGHLPYLHPLVKWRVMDLRGLQDAAALGHSRKNFYRIINHLEAQGMVKTWRDPFNKKKYAYLTPFSFGWMAGNNSGSRLNWNRHPPNL